MAGKYARSCTRAAAVAAAANWRAEAAGGENAVHNVHPAAAVDYSRV